jgi:hypothetical protein
MILLILFSIACCIEAIMDRMYEVYKLPLIDGKGERLNGNWFSYNPLAPEKGLGITRDGWHFLKFVHYVLLAIGSISFAFDPIHIPWYLLLLGLIVARLLCFNITLKYVREKMTAENNFKPITNQ